MADYCTGVLDCVSARRLLLRTCILSSACCTDGSSAVTHNLHCFFGLVVLIGLVHGVPCALPPGVHRAAGDLHLSAVPRGDP
jgi:hypothetical protein